MCFQEVQAVESQVLSTQGQPDVNLHRLTVLLASVVTAMRMATHAVGVQVDI